MWPEGFTPAIFNTVQLISSSTDNANQWGARALRPYTPASFADLPDEYLARLSGSVYYLLLV
jgi:hypothetical protein